MKSGVTAGKQRFFCKECGCNFREGDARTSEKVAAQKALCVLLYAMAKSSFRMMEKILNTNHAMVYRHMQFDEMRHFVQQKIESCGSSKRKTVGWVLGGRDSGTFRRPYNKVSHLKELYFLHRYVGCIC
ncbi:MAG: hypothetical protein LBB60_08340 [Desulfovibrio sp.]|nr:hypothetical protein [Desulfovibrio sp.]